MKDDPDEIILPFFNLFKAFRKRMGGFSKNCFNLNEVGALHYINRKGGVSMKELAGFLDITPPSTTVMTEKLIKLNILKRDYDKNDRRIIIISLNKKGLEMLKEAKKEKIKIAKEMLSRISSEER